MNALTGVECQMAKSRRFSLALSASAHEWKVLVDVGGDCVFFFGVVEDCGVDVGDNDDGTGFHFNLFSTLCEIKHWVYTHRPFLLIVAPFTQVSPISVNSV